MATSSSYNFTVNRNDIIKSALRVIGAIATGETPTNAEITDAAEALNMMIKYWQTEGIGLWLNKEITLFFQNDDYDYDLGPNADNAHCSIASSAIKTELGADAAAAASSVTLDSVTGMTDNFDRDAILESSTPAASGALTLDGALVSGSTATLPSERKILIYSDGDESGITFSVTGTDGDGATVTETITGPDTTTTYSTETFKTVTAITVSGAGTGNIEIGCVGDHIGIELDSGTVHWTYFAAALSTTASLVTALASAASTDNHVYVYTEKIQRPLEIIEARRVDSTDNETPLSIVSRSEYMAISDKDSEGTVNQIYYDPQLTTSTLYVWPEPSDTKERLKMSMKYPIEDFDASTDNADFPIEWAEALKWNLAERLAPEYGTSLTLEAQKLAMETKDNVMSFDKETTSIYIQPDYRG